MKDLDPLVFVAVFQEMLGPLLWVMLLLIVAGTAAFGALLLKERTINSKRLLRAEMAGLLGGGLALVLMAKVSSSGFTDAGGPADWFLIAMVFGLGLAGTAILVYTYLGWRQPAAR
ncbi:MAG: DUF5368 domain-containing protein [Azonexus sp.]|nr:DUF5368 domain-containing protein [Azonexus sp.]